MRLLSYLMRGLHNVVGITAPKPEDEAKVVLIWMAVLVIIFAGTALLGYVLITQMASAR
ncbi:MAG: hypothetical protein ROO76_00085 [Terriglobia bacterium]|jgi:hypothetical protein|nr:hypothetical protein [Terriglobia bacterium]